MKRRAGEDDESVSPIIGVILMVAITVIVATVVASFSMTLASDKQDEPINAAVTMEVDQINKEINVMVTSMGNAEYIVIRGPLNESLRQSTFQPYLNRTGQQMTLTREHHLESHGHVAAIAVQGNYIDQTLYPNNTSTGVPTATIIPVTSQTQVARVDYDFR